MDCSMSGFPVHYQLLKLAQTHVHRVSNAIQPSNHLILCLPLLLLGLQSFPASESFPICQFFASSGQSIGVSVSASVLPMNIQDWFPFPSDQGQWHSTPVLAWRIPWTEEPRRLQSMASLRVGHDWATSLSLFTFMHWRRKWQPTPVFLPRESQGQGSLVGCC